MPEAFNTDPNLPLYMTGRPLLNITTTGLSVFPTTNFSISLLSTSFTTQPSPSITSIRSSLALASSLSYSSQRSSCPLGQNKATTYFSSLISFVNSASSVVSRESPSTELKN